MTRLWARPLSLGALLFACGGDDTATTAAGSTTSSGDSTGDLPTGTTDVPTTGTTGDPGPRGAMALFDPPGDWLAAPWPTDHHRDADGTIDLSRFPLPEGSIFQTHLDHGEDVLRGFALSGTIYFPFAAPLDDASLPDLDASVTAGAGVQLVNVTPQSPRHGQRLPLTFRLYPAGADPYLPHDTLAVRTLPGLVLAEGETYCAYVTDAVRDADGLPVAPAAEFLAALESDPVLAPLRTWLGDTDPAALATLATATCFTTDTPTRELLVIQDYLRTDPAAPPPPVVEEFLYEGNLPFGPAAIAHRFTGTYRAPKFQSGEQPHCLPEDGGAFEFDAEGRPVVQEMEEMRFSLLVPDAPAPASGWPVVLCAHGSGGDFETCAPDSGPEIVAGLAVIGIDLPMHGARGPGLNPWSCLLNPATMRTGLRQSAIDFHSLARAVAAGGFTLEPAFPPQTIAFDPERIYFFGHSLGGLSGSLVMGTVPQIRGGLLSAAGGLTIYSALYRQDWLTFLPSYAAYLGIDSDALDEYHPALTLVQLLNEPGDPLNYAPLWLAPPFGGPPKQILMTSGNADIQTPPITNLVLAAAAGVPVIDPVMLAGPTHPYLGLDPVAMPVTGNLAGTTAALLQVVGDHFVVYDHPDVLAARARFYATLAADGTPTIDTTP
jgi:hypothetical protein